MKKFLNIFKNKKKKIKSDEVYCYTDIIWNTKYNMIILVSYTEEYFNQVIELLDACNRCNIRTLHMQSSYDEKSDETDHHGYPIYIEHPKHYLLLSGEPSEFSKIHTNIYNLGNIILSNISNDIVNNCNSNDFSNLIDDGILPQSSFKYSDDIKYTDECIVAKNVAPCTILYDNIDIILSRLPKVFTSKNIINHINIRIEFSESNYIMHSIYEYIKLGDKIENYNFMNLFNLLSPLFNKIIPNATLNKMETLVLPLYMQSDDDSIPGDIDDDSLDEIFRKKYERFNAINTESLIYEDIDEVLLDNNE